MNFKKMLNYRKVWMAIAILLVIIYHTWYASDNAFINFICKVAYCGVDIFIFASGIGCYYSYDSNNDTLQFIKRRLIRLMPTYWIFIVIWLLYEKITGISAIIGNLFAIQAFSNRSADAGYEAFNFYISAILLLYFLTPIFYKIIKAFSKKYHVVFLIFFVLMTFPFWHDEQLIIIVTRIPLYFLGMLFTHYYGKGEKTLGAKTYFYAFISFVIGWGIYGLFHVMAKENMWSNGLYWYPFLMIVPFICMSISTICVAICNTMVGRLIIDKVFGTIGNYTFEIYLVHILVMDIYSDLYHAGKLSAFPLWSINVMVIITIIAGTFILNRFSKSVMRLLSGVKNV
ncbi:acyltransferase family protein [Lachnospiraceae bacterium C1.1]|nr:acyltransferase [Lachnospiraceae bacterium C1.1]